MESLAKMINKAKALKLCLLKKFNNDWSPANST